MAGPKKAAPKMSVNKWDEDLAKFAQESVATEESVGIGGNMVSVKGGRLSYNGGEVPGNKMNVIIIDYVLGNAYYDEPFDVDNPSSPVCFAFGPHPLGARRLSEHWTLREGQPTCSYYGPANWVSFHVGYHVEHHDFPVVQRELDRRVVRPA